ncbi:hypothetical protein WJ74_35485 [Burkholderia ubonensis]|uniref:DUF4148 domain-containing protein n=1 Tax=Burkholderia ubonensis TaxID=101571 RepID=UPI0007523C59|nr:DUF4148 domain-containing protein [Burkholderia ubonensis]KVO22191.1 hypothetical protein WJ74_35485 [Burkholderia ubonensis]
MKYKILAITLATTFASPVAFADALSGKTRAQVYQELIEAKANGLDYVTDTSYPDISPLHAARFASKAKQSEKRTVADTRSEATPTSSNSMSRAAYEEPCVGPRTFCNPHTGS